VSRRNFEYKYHSGMKKSLFKAWQVKVLASFFCAVIFGFGFSHSAAAAPALRVASWNLGWHIAQSEVPQWLEFCNRFFAREADGVWRVAKNDQAPGATRGWNITENRARLDGNDMTSIPPCGVYRGQRNQSVAVTVEAWAKRNEQLARYFKDNLKPDVLALQEVSGVAAAREALGSQADQYQYCSFDGRFKVQRLVIAWRKNRATAAGPCTVHESLALSHLPQAQQVRPGLSIALNVDGKTVRFFTVHLKSSCVSPLNATNKRRGHLEKQMDDKDPCPILQQQIEPLETIFETLANGVDGFIALGDFNRNLWHEANATDSAVRTDGSDPSGPRAGGVKTINLLREINDGVPTQSRAHLVKFGCNFEAEAAQLCQFATGAALRNDEQMRLISNKGLGCRNGIGLDHALISQRWSAAIIEAEKLPIGRLGNTLAASDRYPEPLLAISDHCPIVVTLNL
jgi:endonuclease/exonuclease/phosphatase family metal-dependent hydrolase